MPQWESSPQERRLARFCRFFAVVYFVSALVFAVAPSLVFRAATLGRATADAGPDALFWNILAVSLMAAIGTACLVTAAHPREGRNALLPVVIALLIATVLGLIRWRSYGLSIVAFDLPLLVITLLAWRSAAPGVHSAPAREGPPPAAEAPAAKVQLGVKAN
jgi:hypothetical protein